MYRAFISYSHQDTQWATWIHRALESYSLPRHLAKSLGHSGKVGKVFRDRDELSTGNNLSTHILEALKDSENLVVVCSPAATQSQWVTQEIASFISMGKRDRIFCLLVNGVGEEAFPPILLADENGNALEPLAADPRDWADGKNLAKLKIVAGLFNLKLDELVQRDKVRQRQRNAIYAALALLGLTLGVASYTINLEKKHQQQEAENLANFVLDLGVSLDKRIDIDSKIAINSEGLRYLEQFDFKELSTKARFKLAYAYRNLANALQQQGENSLQEFEYSLKILQDLHEERPDNEEYLFEVSQAEFYVGADHFYRGQVNQNDEDFKLAAPPMQRYASIMQRLYQHAPDNATYLAEYINALTTQLAIALQGDLANTHSISQDIQALVNTLDIESQDTAILGAAAGALSWAGTASQRTCQLDDALSFFEQGITFNTNARRADRQDKQISENLLNDHIKHVRLLMVRGDADQAQQRLRSAIRIGSDLLSFDPDNQYWQRGLNKIQQLTAQLAIYQGDVDVSFASAEGTEALIPLEFALAKGEIPTQDALNNAEQQLVTADSRVEMLKLQLIKKHLGLDYLTNIEVGCPTPLSEGLAHLLVEQDALALNQHPVYGFYCRLMGRCE